MRFVPFCYMFFPTYAYPESFCIGDENHTTSNGDNGDPAIASDKNKNISILAGIFTRGANNRNEIK